MRVITIHRYKTYKLQPALLPRESTTAPAHQEQSTIQSSPNSKTVRIHVMTTRNSYKDYTIPRSLIKTSIVLLSRINAPTIYIHWHGTLDVFDMYHAWLFTQNVLTVSELAGRKPSGATTATKNDYVDLICCWGLGQTLRDTHFQDMVVSSIIQRLQSWTGTNTPPFVYALTARVAANVWRETTDTAPLRRLILDAMARFGRVEDFEHFRQDPGYPPVFVRHLLVALGREMERRPLVRHDQLAFTTALIPPPLPTPFFYFEAELAAQQHPKSILRTNATAGPGGGMKQVRFEGQSTGFAEDECVYHMHRQLGAPCWRVGL